MTFDFLLFVGLLVSIFTLVSVGVISGLRRFQEFYDD